MPAFTQDVFESTEEKPMEDTYAKYMNLAQKRAKAAAEQYGAWGQPTEVPKASIADQLKAERAYKSGEFARREQAAGQKYGLAKDIETSRGGIADRVRAALQGREELKQDVWDTQSKMFQSNQLALQEQQQQFDAQMGKMNYASFANAAGRIDALQDAYNKGNAEFQMLQAAQNNMLTMADIDKYYGFIMNDFENDMRDLSQKSEWELKNYIAKMEAQMSNTGGMIDGLFGIIQTVGGAYMRSK